jgi:hypothetical protein
MAEKELDSEFLATYEKEENWAEAHGISQRTVKRYRALPDGLPFLIFGGWVWIPKEAGREWIASRIQRRNPRRSRCRHAPQAEQGAAA